MGYHQGKKYHFFFLRAGLLNFSMSDIWGRTIFLVWGTVLCEIGCLAELLAFTLNMSEIPTPVVTFKNVPRHCLMSPVSEVG